MDKKNTIRRCVNDGKTNFYTKISNDIVKNPHLSFTAIGLLTWMLSQHDSYEFTKEYIQKQSGLGKDRFSKAWKELVHAGHIFSEKTRLPNGTFGKVFWFVDENGEGRTSCSSNIESEDDIANQIPENHTSDNHGPENRSVDDLAVGNGQQIINNVNHDQLNHHQLSNDQPNNSTNSGEFYRSETSDPVSREDVLVDKIVPGFDSSYEVLNPTTIHDVPLIMTDRCEPDVLASIQPYINTEEVKQVWWMYSYVIWRNVTSFSCESAQSWKMNKKDYDALYSFVTELPVHNFSHTIQVADSIVEKAVQSGVKYLSVSYLCSNVLRRL